METLSFEAKKVEKVATTIHLAPMEQPWKESKMQCL